MVGLKKLGLSYRDISVRTGNAVTTVMRMWNIWLEQGGTQRRADSVPRNAPSCSHGREGLYSFVHSVE